MPTLMQRVNKMIEQSKINYEVYRNLDNGDSSIYMKITLPNKHSFYKSYTEHSINIGDDVLYNICIQRIKERIADYVNYHDKQLEYENKQRNSENKEVVKQDDKKNILCYFQYIKIRYFSKE